VVSNPGSEHEQKDVPSQEEKTMTDFSAFIGQHAAEFSAFTFLAGLAAGHWLALGRDKRKDFNTLAIPVFDALIKQRGVFEAGGLDKAVNVPWQQLQPLLPFWQRLRLRSSAKRYDQAINDLLETSSYDDWNGMATWDQDIARRVVPAIDRLVSLLRPR
jgi:hypothetical protein